MHGHRDVVAESKVVEEVDREEEKDVREPAGEWDSAGFEEEGGVGEGEVGRVGESGGEEKLNKGYEEA